MESIVLLLVVLIIGYISTHFIFSRIQLKYYVPSGVEYVFLGIILGPNFSNWINSSFKINYLQIINQELLSQISPGLTASIGILGFIYGLNFKFSAISKAEPEHWRIAFSEILTSLVLIGLTSFSAFYYFFYNGNNLNELIAAAYALSIVGALSSNFIIRTLREKNDSTGVVGDSLHNSSLINSNLNIFLYGLLFGIIHIGSSKNVFFTSIEWIVISILLAILIGFLFFIFIGRETDENKLFVAVLGVVLFTSGIGYYLNFSPLYMNFILGATLTNVSKVTVNIEKSLKRLSHPLNILIVVIAGFMWVPADLHTFLIAVPAFILLRFLSKYIAGYISFHSAYSKEIVTAKIGNGLMSLDIIACAMVVDYMNVYKNELTPIVVSAILSGVILFNIFGFSFAKNLLIDVGEITGEKL